VRGSVFLFFPHLTFPLSHPPITSTNIARGRASPPPTFLAASVLLSRVSACSARWIGWCNSGRKYCGGVVDFVIKRRHGSYVQYLGITKFSCFITHQVFLWAILFLFLLPSSNPYHPSHVRKCTDTPPEINTKRCMQVVVGSAPILRDPFRLPVQHRVLGVPHLPQYHLVQNTA